MAKEIYLKASKADSRPFLDAFPPPEALKAFLKVKNARALRFLEALGLLAYGAITAGEMTC